MIKYKLEYVPCNLCGKIQFETAAYFKSSDLKRINKTLIKKGVRAIGSIDGKFKIVRCKKCDLYWINPRLSKKDLARFYNGFYLKKFEGENISFEESVYGNLNIDQEKGRLKEIKRFKKKGFLLDIGAGPGHFLKIAKDDGFKVWGYELSQAAIKIARDTFKVNIASGEIDKLAVKNNFFDVITLHSTLEHTPNPAKYINIAYQKLKDDGLLVFNVPNYRSITYYLVKLLNLPNPGLIFEHLYYFTPSSVTTLLKDKFDILEITSFHHSRPKFSQLEQTKKPKTQSRLSIFFSELSKANNKTIYIKNRLLFFQIRLLKEFLEYNSSGGKLRLGDVIYVFAQKKSPK